MPLTSRGRGSVKALAKAVSLGWPLRGSTTVLLLATARGRLVRAVMLAWRPALSPMNNLRTLILCTLVTPLGVACFDQGTASMATGADGTTDGAPTTGADSNTSGVPMTSGTPTSATTTTGVTDSGDITSTGETGETTGTSGTTGAKDQDDTIYEIQDGTIAQGVDVDVQGVIVTGVSDSGFFAEEPGGGQFSGVLVFIGAPPAVAIGDEVDIVGTTDEFNSITEINAGLGSVTPTGAVGLNLPPDVVTAADLTAMAGEPWEGVLVRIEGAPLAVTNLPRFSEFDVNDGGVDDTRVDGFLYNVFDFPATFPSMGVGASFTAIQGPLNFSFGEFKIAPRDENDLEGYVAGEGGRLLFSQDNNANGLYELSLVDGAATALGVSGVTSSTVGLTYHGGLGNLYGSAWAELLDIQPDGSGSVPLGGIGLEGLAYDSVGNVMYGAINNNFYEIDPANGASLATLAAPGFDVEGIAVDPAAGLVYGIGNGMDLVAFDIVAGTWSIVADTGMSWSSGGLAFDELSGMLYACGISQGTSLYQIDPSDGTPTLVGDAGIELRGGLTIAPAL